MHEKIGTGANRRCKTCGKTHDTIMGELFGTDESPCEKGSEMKTVTSAQKAFDAVRKYGLLHQKKGHQVRIGTDTATCYICQWSACARRDIRTDDLPGIYTYSVVIH